MSSGGGCRSVPCSGERHGPGRASTATSTNGAGRGTFRDCWTKFPGRHCGKLDLSSADLDGSHTPAIRGGQGAACQGRKKKEGRHALYLTDRQGPPLAMSGPVSGNDNGPYDIEVRSEVVTATLEAAEMPVEGLFLNADAGPDSKEFRKACGKKEADADICFNKRNGNTDRDGYFGQEPYGQRYAIERTNAWMDGYRSLLNRFDTTTGSWKGLDYLAFIVIAAKKFLMEKSK